MATLSNNTTIRIAANISRNSAGYTVPANSYFQGTVYCVTGNSFVVNGLPWQGNSIGFFPVTLGPGGSIGINSGSFFIAGCEFINTP